MALSWESQIFGFGLSINPMETGPQTGKPVRGNDKNPQIPQIQGGEEIEKARFLVGTKRPSLEMQSGRVLTRVRSGQAPTRPYVRCTAARMRSRSMT